MAASGKKAENKTPAQRSKAGTKSKSAAKSDPNAVHDIYSEDDLDPAYDKTIADDIAFDNEDDE